MPTSNDPPRRRSPLASLGLRPGEGRLCALLFSLHFLLLAFQYAAKSVRQATFVDAFGAARLPLVYLLAACVAYPVLRAHARAIDRWSQHRLLAVSCLLGAVGTAAFWWLFGLAVGWVEPLFYLWVAVAGVFLVSQLWALAAQLLDARQARRLFGLVGAGGLLGGIAGGQLARLGGELLGTRGTLWLAGGVLAMAAAVASRAGAERAPRQAVEDAPFGRARDGLESMRRSPHLRLLAALTLLSAAVAQAVDLQFSWAVETHTAGLDQRTATFGNLYSVIGVAAFAFQLLATSRIHRRLGVAAAMRVLPLADGVGSALFLAAAALAPALLLPAAWLLKASENGLRYSLDQATRELLFLPIDARDRPKAKAFIDVFVQRAGKGLGAVALLPVTFGVLSVVATAWANLAAIAVWLTLVAATRRRYLASFRDVLRRRPAGDEGAGEVDGRTVELLVEGLGRAEPRQVLHSLDLLLAHGRGRLVPPLLLHHTDPAVRCRTLDVLVASDRSDALPLVTACLADPAPEVRATAARSLGALAPEGIDTLLRHRLHDPDARVRAAAVGHLLQGGGPAARQAAGAALEEMLADGEEGVRLAAARALGEVDDPLYQAALVRLLYDRRAAVARGAIDAVARRAERGGRCPLYLPILVARLHDRRAKHAARDALVAYGAAALPALGHFLLDTNEEIWVRRALPKTIARIGGAGAVQALAVGLDSPDAFLRRKVIEALAALYEAEHRTLPAAVVAGEVAADARAALRCFVDLVSLAGPGLRLRGVAVEWPDDPDATPLLERLLADRLEGHLGNLCGLLALLYGPAEIRAAQRSLGSRRREVRAHAVEYLDNLLDGAAKRLVLPLLDDLPTEERLRSARRLFDLAPEAPEAVLERLATHRRAGDVDAAWITAAALHAIHERRLTRLYPLLARLARDDAHPLVQESAARWAPVAALAGREAVGAVPQPGATYQVLG